jgi:hypothetical protein
MKIGNNFYNTGHRGQIAKSSESQAKEDLDAIANQYNIEEDEQLSNDAQKRVENVVLGQIFDGVY